jgi:ATP-dependent protease ClpP protease subunit
MRGFPSATRIVTAVILQFSISLIANNSYADVRITDDGEIEIFGTIKKGDAVAFKRAVDSLSQETRIKISGVPYIPVDLNSPGGDVMEAVEIGRVIHSKFLTTRAVKQQCSSACVFILIAGVMRAVSDTARIGLHRPHFDPEYFANLTAEQARGKYNELVEQLRAYFIEMGGDERAFRIIMRTSSDKAYFINEREIEAFGFRGDDPAWDEHNEAILTKQYGKRRWPFMKKCLESQPNGFNNCQLKAIQLYPND